MSLPAVLSSQAARSHCELVHARREPMWHPKNVLGGGTRVLMTARMSKTPQTTTTLSYRTRSRSPTLHSLPTAVAASKRMRLTSFSRYDELLPSLGLVTDRYADNMLRLLCSTPTGTSRSRVPHPRLRTCCARWVSRSTVSSHDEGQYYKADTMVRF